MTEPDQSEDVDELSPVEELAERYLERIRRGERPQISEYTNAHPDLAEEIREVFHTLAMLEEFAPDHNNQSDYATTLSTETPAKLGDYRIVRELGRGGMGVVYEAEHGTMRRRVALKVLHTRAAKREHNLERFMREARSAGRLHHTNIVPVFEVGIDQDVHFYAMQCIRGQNLDLVISDLRRLRLGNRRLSPAPETDDGVSAAQCLLSGRFRRSEITSTDTVDEQSLESPGDSDTDRLSETDEGFAGVESGIEVSDSTDLSSVGGAKESYFHRIARVGLQVAEALAYAHDQGVLHRDIKPANLILDTAGTVWVTDFGLARSEGDDLTHTGDIVGTLRYMAPERFLGTTDVRSDIYSLGLTLYELCTLQHAFDSVDRAELIHQVTRLDAPRPSRINSLIPADLETIVLKCISREPSDRYATAHLLADDLRLLLADRPVQARRSSVIEQAWRWCRRNPAVAAMLSFIVLLLTVIFVGSMGFAVKTQLLNDELVHKTQRAERAEEAERKEHADSKLNLYEALFRHALAERRNQLTGRQDVSLDALSAAASMLPNLGLSTQEVDHERFRLRNEAVAALGQTGMVVDRSRMPDESGIGTFAYNYDYDYYAVSRGDIEVYRVADNVLSRRIPQRTFRATNMHFSRNNRFLAALHRQSSPEPRFVQVWDLENDSPVLNIQTPVTQICFSPVSDGNTPPDLAVVSRGTAITIYRECDSERAKKHDFGFEVANICYSGDGKRIAAVGNTDSVEFWSPVDDVAESLSTPYAASAVAWSAEKNRLAVGFRNGIIHLHDLDQPESNVLEFHGHEDDMKQLSLTPDGLLMASTAWDGTTRVWDVRQKREFRRLENHAIGTGFSRDGLHFSSVDIDKRVTVFRITRNGPKRDYFDGRDLPRRNDVSFHPKNFRLAAVATSDHVELWDLQENRIAQMLKTQRTFVSRFSHDGRRLLTSGRHGLRLWKIAVPDTGPLPDTIGAEERFLIRENTYRTDATPDLQRIVTVIGDGTVVVVDATQQQLRLERHPGSYMRKVGMSPDGRWVITPRTNGKGLPVWDAATGEHITELSPEYRVTSAAFSPDGDWLAGHGTYGRFLWRTDTWELLHHQAQAAKNSGVTGFSADSRMIVMPHDLFSFQLIDRQTFRRLAILNDGKRKNTEFAAFDPQGKRLGITLRDNFEVWDLANLQERLKAMNLGWKDP